MIAPVSSFAPALAGLAGGLTSLRMGGGEYKPWDVKQEGGQMDAGWGTGKFPNFRWKLLPFLFHQDDLLIEFELYRLIFTLVL